MVRNDKLHRTFVVEEKKKRRIPFIVNVQTHKSDAR